MSDKKSPISLGKKVYNREYLRSVSEEKAVKTFCNDKRDQVVNAWKQANGKTVRNHSKSSDKNKKSDEKKS
tara:strand:+ start:5182 stop:5394 length:213 start_codon:yes stop_codon:yes gene_type:complete